MTALFTTENYQNLTIILRLSPTEISAGSLLREKGAYLEEIDRQNSTDFVEQVKTAIYFWMAINDEKNTAIATDTDMGVKRQRVEKEYEIVDKGRYRQTTESVQSR
jgi:hypothetical protein